MKGVGTRAGFSTILVLATISIATLVLVRLQSSAYRQASSGREAVAATRARWAARAGLEATIARLAHENRGVERVSAFAVYDAMDGVASGELEGARFEIVRYEGSRRLLGPADPHAKININLMGFDDLMELEGMTEDVAASIIDWIDADDLVSQLGTESNFYEGRAPGYTARNGPIQSLRELELVFGVRPELVRGEDWNLNGRLDPNENDGERTWPDDNEDGRLDAGWSEWITTESVDLGLAASGRDRLNLLTADQRTLIDRAGPMDALQARVILEWASLSGIAVEQLIGSTLQQLALQLPNLGVPVQNVENLNDEQIERLLRETTIRDENEPAGPGRLNLNTVRRETLDYVTSIPPRFADLLILQRNSSASGLTSMLDLEALVSRGQIVQLANILTVESNAFVVTSIGRDVNSGIEVEIVATIERSALPIVISDLSER